MTFCKPPTDFIKSHKRLRNDLEDGFEAGTSGSALSVKLKK